MARNRVSWVDKWGGFSEGKIKGGGVTPRLTPCLHIGFRNSTAQGRGVTGFALTQVKLGFNGGVTLYFAPAISRRVCFAKMG
jgi:hypothetical protein